MFEKYNIDELFLAKISIIRVNKNNLLLKDIRKFNLNVSNELKYSFKTIIYYKNGIFIDLKNMKKIDKCAIIEIIGPLSNYYTQDGKKKVNRRESIKSAKLIHDYLDNRRMKY